jgi:hypothetical protein
MAPPANNNFCIKYLSDYPYYLYVEKIILENKLIFKKIKILLFNTFFVGFGYDFFLKSFFE